MYLIDTNIFLEILLQQENSEECKKLLRGIARGELKAIVSIFTVHGVEGMLTDDLKSLDKFLTNIKSLVNLEVVETDIDEERQAISFARSENLDFDDALQYSVAKREDVEAIISYDPDFDRTDLERKKPGEILSG